MIAICQTVVVNQAKKARKSLVLTTPVNPTVKDQQEKATIDSAEQFPCRESCGRGHHVESCGCGRGTSAPRNDTHRIIVEESPGSVGGADASLHRCDSMCDYICTGDSPDEQEMPDDLICYPTIPDFDDEAYQNNDTLNDKKNKLGPKVGVGLRRHPRVPRVL